MRKLFIAFFVFFSLAAISQSDLAIQKKPKQFIAVIYTMSNNYDKGLLKNFGDSTITVRSLPAIQTKFSKKENKRPLNTYAAENIETIFIKNKNAKTKNTLIGAGIGLLAGVVIGLASGDDPVYEYPNPENDILGFGTLAVGLNNAFALTAGQKALILGTGGMGTGALVGAIIGSLARKKFIINGKREKFEAMKLSVLERTYSR